MHITLKIAKNCVNFFRILLNLCFLYDDILKFLFRALFTYEFVSVNDFDILAGDDPGPGDAPREEEGSNLGDAFARSLRIRDGAEGEGWNK